MEQKRFLRRLRKALIGVPKNEVDKLVDFYTELIEDKSESGLSAYEIFSELESPEKIAADFKRDNNYNGDCKYGEPVEKKKHGALFYILTSPFWLVVAILAFTLGVVTIVVGAALIVAVVTVSVCFSVCGLYVIIMSIKMFTVNLSIALSQVGAGVLLIGLGSLIGMLVVPMSKGYGKTVAWIFRGFKCSKRDKPERKSVSGGKIATAIFGAVLVVVGGITGAIGYGKLDFDYKKLAIYDDYVQQVETYAVSEIDTLSLNAPNIYVVVKPIEGEDIILTYHTSEDDAKTVSTEGSTLNMEGTGGNGFKKYLENAWNRGLAYESLRFIYNRVTVELPASYTGELNIEVKNSVVTLAELNLGDVTIKTSNAAVSVSNSTFGALSVEATNGAIQIKEVTVSSVSAKTDNGFIELEDVTAQTVTVLTSNGLIEVTRLNASQISLETSNGAIEGSVVGSLEQFKIDANCTNGHCNLTNTQTGEKTLYVRTRNGSIIIKFVA